MSSRAGVAEQADALAQLTCTSAETLAMGRPRTWEDADLVSAVPDARSIAQVLRALGLSATGANYKHIRHHIERLGLSTDHFKGQGWSRGMTNPHGPQGQPLDEILVRDSHYTNTASLKRRLLKEGLLTEECSECSVGISWNGRALELQLDHVNGDNRDHRLVNLRLLCPNCHSQTDTFCRPKGA